MIVGERMRARLARSAAAVLVLALAGCASADPVVEVDPAPADAVDAGPAAEALTVLLTEVTAHVEGATDTPTTIVSAGATVDVAVAELTDALDLGDGARDFAAATAFELALVDDGPVTTVEIEASDPVVVGSHDGMSVATVVVVQRTARSSGPVTETTVTYAIGVDGDRLADVMAWNPGLDSGVGLASPTGAAQRFIDLVRAGDLESARYFSGGVNTDVELQVLAAAARGPLALTELPQARMGSARVVYATDPDGRVVARFEVLLGSETKVVYSPTS